MLLDKQPIVEEEMWFVELGLRLVFESGSGITEKNWKLS